MTGYVYFIQGMPSGSIKIGYSTNPKKRMTTLKISNPEILTLLGVIPGTPDTEKDLHRLFHEDRIRGEWFFPSHALMEHITALFPTQLPLERMVLTPTETATMLGISTRTLRERKRAGLIPWVPFGKRGVGYRHADIEASLEASVKNAVEPAPAPTSTGRIPPLLAQWIAEGRHNDLTGRKYGEAAS